MFRSRPKQFTAKAPSVILSGSCIAEEVAAGTITIEPYTPLQITTNSYDLRLGSQLKVYVDESLDFKADNRTIDMAIPSDGLLLRERELYLGHTLETLGSRKYAPIVKAKSSTARLGLFVHITADLIDVGSINQWTLQLYPVHPVRVYPGMLIAQATFWTVRGDINLYDGKYQGAVGPVGSRSFMDFRRDA